MKTSAHVLATYARSLQFADVPTSVISNMKLHLLDAAGTALYGSRLPWTQMIHDVLASWEGKPEATVWNSTLYLPAPHAAFLNSVATHAFELDDRRVASYMHPASGTLPAALAVADAADGVSGEDLLTAVIAGYEVGLRVGRCIGRGAFERGFYPPGIGGAFAATVTTAKLRDLTIDQLIHALSLTATQAAGLYTPTMVKRFNLGRGTYNGILAIDLARAGYAGIADVFEADVGGFLDAYTDRADPSQLVAGLGEEFESEKVEIKPYVSSRPNHTAIDCILSLRRRAPHLSLKSLARIDIETSTANYRFGAGFPIESVPQALMSTAYCVAVAFLDGDAFLDQFTEERIADPQLQDLMSLIEVQSNPEFDALGLEQRDMTRIRCYLKDGEVIEEERAFAKGHPADPLSTEDVIEKFRQLTKAALVAHERAEAVERAFLELERLDDVRDINQLMGNG